MGARRRFISASRVTTTLYNCRLPIVWVRMASSNKVCNKASSIGWAEYFLIVLRLRILFIVCDRWLVMGLVVFDAVKHFSNELFVFALQNNLMISNRLTQHCLDGCRLVGMQFNLCAT